MNLKHLAVFIGSMIVFLVSVSLFSQISDQAHQLISELVSLYSVGVIAGCGLAVVWLMGEFAGQD